MNWGGGAAPAPNRAAERWCAAGGPPQAATPAGAPPEEASAARPHLKKKTKINTSFPRRGAEAVRLGAPWPIIEPHPENY